MHSVNASNASSMSSGLDVPSVVGSGPSAAPSSMLATSSPEASPLLPLPPQAVAA
jgi:hypothetical protein